MEKKLTTLDAAITLVRLCIGPGLLALPFATSKGGLILAPLGILLFGVWNIIACEMMMRCKNASRHLQFPLGVTSEYSKIAYAGFGWLGVRITDWCIFITLIGVCIAYQINFATLIADIPSVPFTTTQLICIGGLLLYPICCVKNLGVLAPISGIGLFCIFLNIFAVFGFGFSSYGQLLLSAPDTATAVPLGPQSLSGLSSFVGVAVFCFGICSLAFPVEESMEKKEEFPMAVMSCVIFVCIFYTIVGDGSAMLYVHDINGINGNILLNLPQNSISACIARVAMAAVCLLTYPLTFLPPAQMIEELIVHFSCQLFGRRSEYEIVEVNYSSTDESVGHDQETKRTRTSTEEPSITLRYLNRLVMVALTTLCATSVPCFSFVVSLLGCFTLTVLSFVLPPLLHMMLVTLPGLQDQKDNKVDTATAFQALDASIDLENMRDIDKDALGAYTFSFLSLQSQHNVDIVFICSGSVICIVGTVVTFLQIVSDLSSKNGQC